MKNDLRALEELSRRLWDERRLVTHLLFKLSVTRLLLAADERRFVPEALREVEEAVEILRSSEIERRRALRELAGLSITDPAGRTIGELARRCPPPFDHVFADHIAAFRELAGEIERIATENRRLAAGHHGADVSKPGHTRQRLELTAELADVEDLDISEGLMELQIQEVAYEATLAALGRALPPSLVAFLG